MDGEWWIDDSGYATFADGDVGDQNHEIIAFWSALGINDEELRDTEPIHSEVEEILEWLKTNHPDEYEYLAEMSPEDLTQELIREIENMYDSVSPVQGAILINAYNADEDAVKWFVNAGSSADARSYQLEKNAWIRVAGNNFQVWNFDDSAKERICSFIFDEFGDEISDEDEVSIEQLRDQKYFSVEVGDLCSSKSAAAILWSAQRERTGFYNPY